MITEPLLLVGVEKSLQQIADENWKLTSLDVDLEELSLDLEDICRDPEGVYGLEPEDFGLDSFEGENIEDYLDPAGTIHASYTFMKDGTYTGEHISMRVELLPGGAIKECLVTESGRRAWLHVGNEVPTPAQALRMFRIKYPKKQAA